MVYTLSFFPSSKCILFHNSNVFGSCIIHILYIYSTNIGTEYFKHGIFSPFFPLQKAVCFIILTYLVPVSFTFYIQGVLKFKKNNSGAKRLIADLGLQVGERTMSLVFSTGESMFFLWCRNWKFKYCLLKFHASNI